MSSYNEMKLESWKVQLQAHLQSEGKDAKRGTMAHRIFESETKSIQRKISHLEEKIKNQVASMNVEKVIEDIAKLPIMRTQVEQWELQLQSLGENIREKRAEIARLEAEKLRLLNEAE